MVAVVPSSFYTRTMKTDAYTRVLLTVIAVALLLLSARSFENPTPAFAQRSGNSSPQHVVIDGVQHVIIDGTFGRSLPVTIEDVGSAVLRPLPIKGADIVGPNAVHVIVDELDPGLSLSGVPVSVRSSGPGQTSYQPTGARLSWELAVDGCAPTILKSKALDGWELVQAVLGPKLLQEMDTPIPRSLTEQQKATYFNNNSICYFKRPVR